MHIFIRMLSDKTLILNVQTSDTIRNIKIMIEDIEGIPQDRQCLIFAGRKLEDHQAISDTNIAKESTLFLVKVKEADF